MAKWPPDDSAFRDPSSPALPPSPSGAGEGGSGYDGGDGNFKKGAFRPAAILVGLLLAAGGVAAVTLGVRSEAAKVTTEDAAKERHALALLPRAQALPKWREWAAREDTPTLRQDAFAQLAWAKDPAGLPLIVKGLESIDHRVRGTAAQSLLEYGPTLANGARPALLKALAESDSSDKPQICWALTVLKEPQAFDAVMEEYRLGHLSKVQKLDESPAFDPEVLAALVPTDKLVSLAGDSSESVRQLVATTLSRTGDGKWTPVLTRLVKDPSVEVAREAAVGLGKIANEATMGPLLDALGRADKDSRQKFLEALRDGVGGKGLVLALQSVHREKADREKFQTKQLFDMMRELADPRIGDALVDYLATNPKPHWRTEAALRMAEVGDLRAVPHLAWRLEQDPLKLYNAVDDPELRMDDNERVVSARMLADLAVLYPDHTADIRRQAEGAVLSWAEDKPQPHANALRFLAAVASPKALPKMRAWATPKVPMPRAGAVGDFPMAWATAQSALRYIGWMKDAPSWGLLQRQLAARPAPVDVTMEAMQQGGVAILGMVLRGLAVGASDGFAHWGDPRAYPDLVRHIEDPMNNEQGRIEACFSLAWVATDDQMKEVVKKVYAFNKPDPKSAFIRSCYLETLIRRPVPDATAGLIDLLKPEVDLDVRHQASRAIGFGGVTRPIVASMQGRMSDPALRADAALTLLLGGDTDAAALALAAYEDAKPEEMEELKDIYNRTFGYWSDHNFDRGDVIRWIENAIACSRVRVHGHLQDWPRMVLGRGLQGIEFDNGPHSLTRVQFRVRLLQAAKGANDVKRTAAIETLKFMKERGVLMALRQEPGNLGELAREAFFEVMNPKVMTEALPEPAKAGGDTAPGAAVRLH